MKTHSVRHDDPCPCGSGKKYKACCLVLDMLDPSASGVGDLLEELRKQTEEQPLESIEEAQALLDEYTRQFNRAPLDDLQGLSPEQMYRFLRFPFDSPQLVEFPEKLDYVPDAPVLTLFTLLAGKIPVKGLKLTAKGNLPRKICREIAFEYLGEDGYRDLTLFGALNSEEDYSDLHVVRVISAQAGLTRKYKGKLILGRRCRNFLAESRFDLIYTRLFKTYAGTFSWEYRDPYLHCDLIQTAFLFSLYLLARHGDRPLPASFYEDCFLRALPQSLGQVNPDAYPTPESKLRAHYTERTVVGFFEFFGLARAHPVLSERSYGRDYEVTKRSLLDKVVHFYLV